ncbi:Trehalose-6-P synthase/phosphatase complex synthase subunit [Coemansia sp. RSA 2131]|nr:Trehalose-6-P synthase/phosphatase complex synthase subunit [Coemansia sp. RSA 2131]
MLSDALHQALAMAPAQRKANFNFLYKYVNTHTAAYWGVSFNELKRVSQAADELAQLPQLPAQVAQTVFGAATQGLRVLMLDYDGTLSATRTIPDFVCPLLQTLRMLWRLAELLRTLVYVVSGRIRVHMERWFKGIDVWLVAEHGLFYRHSQAVGQMPGLIQGPAQGPPQDVNGWTCLVEHTDPQWRETVLPLFQHYTERTPGSFIEEK